MPHVMPKPAAALEARNIVKVYPGTTALKNVNFRVVKNKINVLIGENGAGKSTLMRILAGAEHATSGNLILEGRPVILDDPAEAARQGIAMIHQELSVFPNLNIADNIFVGRELRRLHQFSDFSRQETASNAALIKLGVRLDVSGSLAALPLGAKQLVEIARSLVRRIRILILDEPTSALTATECEYLFRAMRDLTSQGVSIVYISHRLQELLEIGDYFTVLRDGSVVGEADRSAVDRGWVVERMTGRKSFVPNSPRTQGSANDCLLKVHELSHIRSNRRSVFTRVSFDVASGEIVGIYGLLGSGATELLEVLGGARQATSGNFALQDRLCRFRSVADALDAGIALVPEERKRDALFSNLSVRENISMSSLHRFGRYFHSRRAERGRARELAAEVHLNVASLEQPVSSLSGGNQQRVLLARCLVHRPKLLLLDQPTRGIDIGTKEEIYQMLQKLAARGLSIVFASTEIEEIHRLAHRVLVLSRGRQQMNEQIALVNDEAIFAAASENRTEDLHES